MSQQSNSSNDPLFNPKAPLDSNLLLSLIIQLINTKPTSCIVIPEFRINQLLDLIVKIIQPITEKKILDSICSLYILCLYYGLSTRYQKIYIFRFISIIQIIISESIINIIHYHKNHMVYMPDIIDTLVRSNQIETEYKLEVFMDALELVKCIARDYYSLMKTTLRVGKKYAPGSPLTVEEKRMQYRYVECIQAYSIYFMCIFAYSHITIMMHESQSLSLLPGTYECYICMLLTKLASSEKPISKAISSDNNTINNDAIKVGIELCMSKAYNLCIFIAHIIYNERSLQEQRLALTRLTKNYNHPKIVYAQHCTSMFKVKLSEGSSNSSSSSKKNKSRSNSGSNLQGSNRSPTSSSSSSSSVLIDIDQSTHHFFHGLSRPLPWHLKDPNEDEDERSMNMNMSTSVGATVGKGGRGHGSRSDTSSSTTNKDSTDDHATIAPVELNMFNTGPTHMNLIDHSTIGIGSNRRIKSIIDETKLPLVNNNNNNNNNNTDIMNKDTSNYSSDNQSLASSIQQAAVGGKDHQAKQNALRIQQYWALTKFFRATYLLLDTLQCNTTTTTTTTTSMPTTTTTSSSSSSSSSVVTEAYNKGNDDSNNHNKYYYDYFEVDYTPSMKMITSSSSSSLSSSSLSSMINDNDNRIDLTKISRHQLPCEMSITIAAKFLEAQYYYYIGHRFSLPIPK